MIQFLLNHTLQKLDHVAPTTSVLQFLRSDAALTGTKEGCAAGDCGACTVATGEIMAGELRYKAINACITPVGSLHSKHLLTIEGLAQGKILHPVQQAMVDCHGSQCGFCTPGMVMSLFVWWQQAQTDLEHGSRCTLESALSGNLCRCTGYEPIFRAAQQALAAPPASVVTQQNDGIKARLLDIAAQGSGSLTTSNTQFLIPSTIEELTDLLNSHPHAQLVAGATDLALTFTQQLQRPAILLYLGSITQLQRCRETDDALSIGAAVTYQAAQPYLKRHFPAFASLLWRLGSQQIRNQGTIVGNVANASPVGDSSPVLLALSARLQLRSASGLRSVPMEDFFCGYRQTLLAPGEFIETIEIPKLGVNDCLKVYKISKRFDDDISAVCLALYLQRSDGITRKARLAFGGMAATPVRAALAEQALVGRAFDADAVATAQHALTTDFAPIDDVRASGAYRLQVAGKLLTRAMLELSGSTEVALFPQKGIQSQMGGAPHA